jgi:hypothetical protein
MTSSYSWAKPGVKVVCVNDEMTFGILLSGAIYEIREVNNSGYGYYLGALEEEAITLRFVGMQDEYQIYVNRDLELFKGFHIERFRPLVEKKLPSSLTSILTNPKKSVKRDQFDKQKTWEPV